MKLSDDGLISGTWCPQLDDQTIESPRTLLPDFANLHRDAKATLHFTKKYGPLTSRPEGEEFSFPWDAWYSYQAEFRKEWEVLGVRRGKILRRWFGSEFKAEEGEGFLFTSEELAYRASTLLRVLTLELYSVPRRHLRKCPCPECLAPYFISADAKRTYCSDVCAAWSQKRAKLEWWNKNRRAEGLRGGPSPQRRKRTG